jgi:predicted alpha-1,6-mannanase (GH76 family)
LQDQYTSYADAGIDEMMTFYDASTGLFGGAWWNSANVITMLADYENSFPGRNKAFQSTIETTLAKAVSPFMPRGSFLNTFYDDELWWVLAWIKVYDVTNDVTYLNKAAEIYEDPRSVWGTTPCNGGIW